MKKGRGLEKKTIVSKHNFTYKNEEGQGFGKKKKKP